MGTQGGAQNRSIMAYLRGQPLQFVRQQTHGTRDRQIRIDHLCSHRQGQATGKRQRLIKLAHRRCLWLPAELMQQRPSIQRAEALETRQSRLSRQVRQSPPVTFPPALCLGAASLSQLAAPRSNHHMISTR